MGLKNAKIVNESVQDGMLIVVGGEIWRVKVKRGGPGGYIYDCEPRRAENSLNNGYSQIQVYKNGERYTCGAHDFIWFFYNGDIPDGCVIHHKNKNKKDNRIENLECVTHLAHNRHHAAERGTPLKQKTKQKRSFYDKNGEYEIEESAPWDDVRIKAWHARTIKTKIENYKQRAIKTYNLIKYGGVSVKELTDSMGITTRSIYQHITDCEQRGWLENADVHNTTGRETDNTARP